MPDKQNKIDLYNKFLSYSYPELEALLLNAKDEDERKFWMQLLHCEEPETCYEGEAILMVQMH